MDLKKSVKALLQIIVPLTIVLIALVCLNGHRVYAQPLVLNNADIPNGSNSPDIPNTNINIQGLAVVACADNSTFSIAELSWISLAGQPLVTTFVGTAGQVVPAQWNVADYYCNTPLDQGYPNLPNPTYTNDLTVATKYSVSSVNLSNFGIKIPTTLQVNPNQGDVWERSEADFNFTLPDVSGGVTGILTYQAINKFNTTNQQQQFQCVGNVGGQFGDRQSLDNFDGQEFAPPPEPICPTFDDSMAVNVIILSSILSSGTLKASCPTGIVSGTVVNANDPNPLAYYIYVNGGPSQANGSEGGPYTAGINGNFSISGSNLPAQLTDIETNGGSAQVTIWTTDSYLSNGTVGDSSIVQVAGPATWICSGVSGGSIVDTCNSTPPEVTGNVYNTDAPANSPLPYQIYVDGVQAGAAVYYTDNAGNFTLSGSTLPSELQILTINGGTATITLYAESYVNGAPTGNFYLTASGQPFTCVITVPTGTLKVSCTAATPYVSGSVFNTDSQSGVILYYIAVDGNEQYPALDTNAAGTFNITGAALPYALSSLENTPGSAAVTLYSQDYIGGSANGHWVKIAGPQTWQCTSPQQPSVGALTASCTAATPNIAGYAYNTELPGSSITFYIYVNGGPAGVPPGPVGGEASSESRTP